MSIQLESDHRAPRAPRPGPGTILGIVAAVLVLGILFGTAYTIDQGEIGVKLRNGEVVAMEDPGLHLKAPLFERIVKFSTRTVNRRYNAIEAYSKDNQPATIRLSVNFHIIGGAVDKLYARYGNDIAGRALDPMVFEKLKEVYGRYQIGSVIERRGELTATVEKELKKSVPQDLIVIETVQLENIDFSDAYEHAIEEAMQVEAQIKQQRNSLEKARVEAEQAKVAAEGQANAMRAQADGAAYARIADARARAEATRIQGAAEADAIRVRGEALRGNPNLPGLVQAERWDGKLPTTVLGNGTVPMISLPKGGDTP